MTVRLLLLLCTAGLAHAQGGREAGRFSLQRDPATVMAIDAGKTHALVGWSNGVVAVFPTSQAVVNLYSHGAHKQGVSAAAFFPDGKSFATVGLDGAIRIWDTAASAAWRKEKEDSNGEANPELPKPKHAAQTRSSINCLAISPDGKTLATGSTDGAIRTWDPELKPEKTLTAAHPGGTRAIAYSPDGKTLASGGSDKTAKVWKIGGGKPEVIHKLEGHDGAVGALAFSPDGKRLATGSGVAKKAGTIHVWEAATAKPQFTLSKHTDLVTCLVFHPKTEHLASGGADSRIRVWSLKDNTEIEVLEHPEPLKCLIISGDGERFGSCSALTVRWWRGFGDVKK